MFLLTNASVQADEVTPRATTLMTVDLFVKACMRDYDLDHDYMGGWLGGGNKTDACTWTKNKTKHTHSLLFQEKSGGVQAGGA